MKNQIVCLCAVFAAGFSLQAQTTAATPAPTPPSLPLLKRVPDATQWVVTYQLKAASSQGGGEGDKKQLPPPKVVAVTKSQGVIVEKMVTANGLKIERWWLPNGTVSSMGGGNWIVGGPGAQSFEEADYSRKDFAGLDWLTLQNFVGSRMVNGRNCLVFKDRLVTVEPSELEAIKSDITRDFSWAQVDDKGNVKEIQKRRTFNIENYKSDVTAYIDDETRLPIALVYQTPQGIITRSYQFQTLSSPLVIPAEVRKALQTFEVRQKKLSVPHAPI